MGIIQYILPYYGIKRLILKNEKKTKTINRKDIKIDTNNRYGLKPNTISKTVNRII